MRLHIRDVEVDGRRTEVEVADGVVRQVGAGLRLEQPPDEVVDGAGGALLPGLHDHHLHLLSLAAERSSVRCGPPSVGSAEELAAALQAAGAAAGPGGWVRGTGYHESVAGELDRHRLDVLGGDRPVRVQHRSGALWMLSSRAVDLLGPRLPDTPDVERDPAGRPTGRLWRLDRLLRDLGPGPAPSLHGVDEELTSLGITGVTDATPDLDEATTALLEASSSSGVLRARVHLLGAVREPRTPRFSLGPVKLLLHDHDLPDLDTLVDRVFAARGDGRAVAVHVVTRTSLALTLAALEVTGTVPGDRLEHAAVVPPELAAELARRGLAVVTQPGFLRTRGETYRAEVDPDDLPCLYPYAGLLRAGVSVAASSDAPFGELDPWRVVADAAARATEAGHVLGLEEGVDTAVALGSYLSAPEAPGGPPRRVRPGAPADLCLLTEPLHRVLADPRRDLVRRTFHGSPPVAAHHHHGPLDAGPTKEG